MAKRGETRAKIIAAASKVFLENGFEASSVKMIIEEAGVVTGSFYHFFPSKEALFEAVVSSQLDEFIARLDEIMGDDDLTLQQVKERFFDELLRYTMTFYESLQGDRLHWTVQSALKERAQQAMISSLGKYLSRAEEKGELRRKLDVDPNALAGIIIRGAGEIIYGKIIYKKKTRAQKNLKDFWYLLIEEI